MSKNSPIASDVAFSATVKAVQARKGSRGAIPADGERKGCKTAITRRLRRSSARRPACSSGPRMRQPAVHPAPWRAAGLSAGAGRADHGVRGPSGQPAIHHAGQSRRKSQGPPVPDRLRQSAAHQALSASPGPRWPNPSCPSRARKSATASPWLARRLRDGQACLRRPRRKSRQGPQRMEVRCQGHLRQGGRQDGADEDVRLPQRGSRCGRGVAASANSDAMALCRAITAQCPFVPDIYLLWAAKFAGPWCEPWSGSQKYQRLAPSQAVSFCPRQHPANTSRNLPRVLRCDPPLREPVRQRGVPREAFRGKHEYGLGNDASRIVPGSRISAPGRSVIELRRRQRVLAQLRAESLRGLLRASCGPGGLDYWALRMDAEGGSLDAIIAGVRHLRRVHSPLRWAGLCRSGDQDLSAGVGA